jgi:hypothetical protein
MEGKQHRVFDRTATVNTISGFNFRFSKSVF